MTDLIEKLLWLSHEIGRDDRHLAILGEGNTSADLGDGTFLIKASGGNLASLDASGLSRVKFDTILDAINDHTLNDSGVREVLLASRADADSRLPSVETFMHAICLREAGAKWIGHCHPVSVLQVLCSQQGATPFLQHVFPDEIVVCGRDLAVVPYIDPGIELARSVRASLQKFDADFGGPPKVILLENHGPVALGQSEREVLNILLMLDKWARILIGNFTLGGPKFLPDATATRIDTRPDEHYRRKAIAELQRQT